MSKHFSNVSFEHGEDLSFQVNDLPVYVANTLRRALMSEIPTYSLDLETIKFLENTSPWDNELVTHFITFVTFLPQALSKHDLNMLELRLWAENTTSTYRYVFASELHVINKETKEVLANKDIVLYPDSPLFTLGPKQKVVLTSSFEFKTKNDVVDLSQFAARHQASNVGYSYKEEDTIYFKVSIYAGIAPSPFVSMAFDSLLQRLRDIQEAIKTSLQERVYIQLNQNGRYDFVLMGENHTLGNLISRWIARDGKSIAGYHLTRDRKGVAIDFGLARFVPAILRQSELAPALEELLETSFQALDPATEKQQRDATIQAFLENLKRLEQYFVDLQEDWKKLRI
jgi:DNA-directed RNA polymerase subunit L